VLPTAVGQRSQGSPDEDMRIWKIQTMGLGDSRRNVNETPRKRNLQHLQAALYATDRSIAQGRSMGGDGSTIDSAIDCTQVNYGHQSPPERILRKLPGSDAFGQPKLW
jgi:hypothetical protein